MVKAEKINRWKLQTFFILYASPGQNLAFISYQYDSYFINITSTPLILIRSTLQGFPPEPRVDWFVSEAVKSEKFTPTERGQLRQSNYRRRTLEILNRLYRIENIKYFTDFEFLPKRKPALFKVNQVRFFVGDWSPKKSKIELGWKLFMKNSYFARHAKMAAIRKVLMSCSFAQT